MAIDTDNKRMAAMSFYNVCMPQIYMTSDGLGQGDQQQLLWGYPGILWSAVVAGDVLGDDRLPIDISTSLGVGGW